MQVSIVEYKALNSELRLDSEYYKPEYLRLNSELRKYKTVSFGKLVKEIRCGPFGSTVLSETYFEDGVILARPFNINNFTLERDNLVYVSDEDVREKKLRIYEEGDIFFSRVGDVRCGIVPKFDSKITISPNIIAVRVDREKVNPYYVTIFFNTKYGFPQIERGLKVVAQPTIQTDLISDLVIVELSNDFQTNIENIFRQYFDLDLRSIHLYFKAEQILLSELGLLDWKPQHQLSFVRSFSDTKSAGRIDAEYFQPKYGQIKEVIKKSKYVPLTKYFETFGGRYFDYVADGEIGVIKTKQVSKRYVSFEVESTTSERIFVDKRLAELRNADILFASMGRGSLGKTNIYYEFENSKRGKFTIDSTIKIIRKKPNSEIKSELLTLYLSSLVGQELIYQNIVGTSGIISIYKDDLGNLPVPLLDNNVQERISEFVIQAHKDRRKSKQLLDIAKRGVEMAIEQNEEEATRWLNEEVESRCQITM